MIGEYNAGVVRGNVVSHNQISGTLHVSAGDCGGYNGSPVSDTPSVVDVAGIELTEASDPDPLAHVIHDNGIGFNDLRGTATQIALTPSALDNPINAISRNLGENRGHGLHPAAFEP